MGYIDADKLKELIDEKWKELADKNVKVGGGKWDIEISIYLSVLRLIDSLQQEQPELYKKDESLGSPDYERGFKHGRDYQTEVTRKYTDKDKVVAYFVDKGYPISTTGEIPTYQETFDMISNAIKYTIQQEQPEVD